MARYIDADKLKEQLKKHSVVTDDMYGMGITRGIDRAETAIDMTPTADVVPKSEVENIFAEIELEIKEALDSNYEARRIRLENKHEKREIPACYCGDEFICICDGKITALREIEYFLAELKKKYAGENE